jgi:FkbM family methyltransferase
MEEKYLQAIETIFNDTCIGRLSKELIRKIESAEKVVVYGAGAGGRYTGYLLSLINVRVYAYADMNAEKIREIDGVKVCTPSALADCGNKDGVIIIIGVGDPGIRAEIECMLRSYGYTNIISYIELFNEVFLMADDRHARYGDLNFFKENKTDMIAALSLFADEKSKDIYVSFIKGHALKNNEYFAAPEVHTKYIPDDIPFSKGFGCFIDCGAGTGETYESLEKKGIRPGRLVMFEPDKYNFSLLSGKMKNKNQDAYLYPCAVYSYTGLCGFSHSATQGSYITDNSSEVVQCVKLDDVLVNLAPTYIKMDIEGAEYEALLGARSLISECKPDLAICVYHAVNHIWDIPILINSLHPGYRMYLRSGNIYGMNTVLFAISDL